MPRPFVVEFLLGLLAGPCVVGCSSSTSGSSAADAPAACGTATVSFQADVMPVFAANCSTTGACHGQMQNAGEESLYLGLNASEGVSGPSDVQAVYSGLVGVASVEDPSMKLVASGDPADSFLWHKVNGDQNTDSTTAGGCQPVASGANACSDCVAGAPCGVQMPFASSLAPADVCTIENWISQGALDN
jgi:hypothetical protein